MDTETQKLVEEIVLFCDFNHITPSTFGTRVMNDGGFVKRLEAGGSTSLRSASKVRKYIANNSPAQAGA